MSELFTLRFRYRKDEYLRSVRFHVWKTMGIKLDLVLAVLFGLAGTYFLLTQGISWISVGGFLVCIMLLLIVFIALVVLPLQVYRESDKLKQDYEVTFSEEGIHFRTLNIDSRLEWDLYNRWIEGLEFFILYYGKREFTVIPKRIFGNDTARMEFKDLISRKISDRH